ncbi:glutamyl-tRNA reductase [Homoserinimonas sp. OAct 916]|uniref:glutamyl-tRNA reductase n=1 Tax=Homoserinimonas sp. OAct 916 TaxID=2211450 RepID=UPI000DBE3817|nr:glutamyl-tRNA reductase [Homoserinimonas sp. OAct 916]
MLLCLTANHSNARFTVLETLSRKGADAADQLHGSGDITGTVVLATCNRFEVYLEVDDALTVAEIREKAVERVSAASELRVDILHSSMTFISGDLVAEHLFAVSAGLESVVVGEDEISGQVQRALASARKAGTTSSGLERLFQSAARAARDVKTSTGLGGAGRSLVRLALDLASSRVTSWAETRVLVIGTGQYAGTTIASFKQLGVMDLRVFSPSGRGADFAARHGLRLEETLTAAIASADVVITCTASTVPVVTKEIVADGRSAGAASVPRSCLIIDLGMPRNVDPAVADVTDVELLDLDTIRLHAPIETLNATRHARELVNAAALEFSAGSAEKSLTASIVALRAHVFELLDTEIARTRARAGGASTAREEEALRHMVGVLLHTPSLRARELARTGGHQCFIDGLHALFGIQADDPAPENTGPGRSRTS